MNFWRRRRDHEALGVESALNSELNVTAWSRWCRKGSCGPVVIGAGLLRADAEARIATRTYIYRQVERLTFISHMPYFRPSIHTTISRT
jgi:hypothetical protein